MRPIPLDPEHVEILRALHTYRLLTQAMICRLGLARQRTVAGQLLGLLERHHLVKSTPAKLVEGVRRLPFLYWLTEKGARALNELDGLEGRQAARGARRRLRTMHEILHRVGLVELHMAVRQWVTAAGVGLDGFVVDFEPGSKGRQKRTKIEDEAWRLLPDGLAWLRLPGEELPRLLVIELERGGDVGDLYTFFSKKLPRLRKAAEEGRVEGAFEAAERPIQRPRFVVVFGSHVVGRDGQKVPLHLEALRRWPDPADPVWAWFFVQGQDEAQADFGGLWHQPGGRPQRPLFNIISNGVSRS